MTAVAGTETARTERRGRERRVRVVSLRYPEQRTGFDRRVTARYQVILDGLRSNPWAIAGLLWFILLLNALDLALTVQALKRGATEANPVMAWLLEQDMLMASTLKLGLGLAVALTVWQLRKYRRMLELSLVLVGFFGLVLGYHLAGLLLIT